MTKEQKNFVVSKIAIKKLEEASKERPLTPKEKAQMDRLKKGMFDDVIRFGMSRAHERMDRYRLDVDAYKDIYQSFAEIFYRHLPDYDPLRSTPTTFFVSYFDQVISEYLHSSSQKLTAYDARNLSLVRAAIHEFESKGVKWNDEMVAARTGLSIKVTRNTLLIAMNSIQKNIDDTPNIDSHELTPEEMYLKNEKQSIVFRAIRESLTDNELDFFLYKVNPEGTKRSIKEAAEYFEIPHRDATQLWSKIIAKLYNVKSLRQYAGEDGKATSVAVRTKGNNASFVIENAIPAFANVKIGDTG